MYSYNYLQLFYGDHIFFLYRKVNTWKFWRFNNRLPNASNSKGIFLNVSSLSDCYDEYVKSLPVGSRGQGFAFNRNTKKCTVYSGLSTFEVECDAGSELYIDNSSGRGMLF